MTDKDTAWNLDSDTILEVTAMSTSRSIQTLPVVAAYAREHGGDVTPVIVEAFKPGHGWKRYPFKKRISLSWARKMMREGYTTVSLNVGGGHADFKLAELCRSPRHAMKSPVSAGTR